MTKLHIKCIFCVFFFLFFVLNGLVFAETEYDFGAKCGLTGSYSENGGMCDYDILTGDWFCDSKRYSGSQTCYQLNTGQVGGVTVYSGCAFQYSYATCSDSACQSRHAAGETTNWDIHYCCTPKTGSCGGDGASCDNPGRCSRGDAVDQKRSGNNWLWKCTGTCGGGKSDWCSAPVIEPVKSVCGAAENPPGGEYQEGVSTPVGAANSYLCGPENKVYWTTAQNDDCKGWCNSDSSKEYYRWLCKGACRDPVKCSAKNDAWPRAAVPQLYRDPAVTLAPDEPEPTPVAANTYNGVSINNICQSAFDGSLRVLWRLNITDANGVDDIKSAQLRFVPTTGGDPIMSVVETPVNGVADFIMNTSIMTAATYKVEYQLEDKNDPPGKGPWTDSTRSFKAWDCMVGIGGTFYDSSLVKNPSCVKKYNYRLGYTTLISDQLNFGWSYVMINRTNEQQVDVGVSSPYYFSTDTSQKLKWSDDPDQAIYQPRSREFPGQLVAQTRVNNTTCLKNSLDLNLSTLVNPYVDNPSIKADYTGKMSQDTWFSVSGGHVFSWGKINNSVPFTCQGGNSDDAKCSTSVHGIVWTHNTDSTLSYLSYGGNKYGDETKIGAREFYNKPAQMVEDMRTYDYKYFADLGIGTSVVGNETETTLWSSINNLTGVVLVDGDLNIDEDIKDVSGDQFRLIVAKGAIDIGTSVNEVDAVLIGGYVNALGISSNQLKIVGAVNGIGGIEFTRSFPTINPDGSVCKNNSTPAVLVQYDPRIIKNIPSKLSTSVNRWQNE